VLQGANLFGDLLLTFLLDEHRGVDKMGREELKSQIDELMRQYADEEIDGATYSQKMMELTTSYQDENQAEE